MLIILRFRMRNRVILKGVRDFIYVWAGEFVAQGRAKKLVFASMLIIRENKITMFQAIIYFRENKIEIEMRQSFCWFLL